MMRTPTAFLALILLLLSEGAKANDLSAESVPGEYVVKLAAEHYSLPTKTLAKYLGAEIIEKLGVESSAIVVRRPMIEAREAAISELSEHSFVEVAEPNFIYRISKTANDPGLTKLWGMKNSGQLDPGSTNFPAKQGKTGVDIGVEAAWDITTGNSDVIVGIIDTGIDFNHEDLKDNMWVNVAEKNGQSGVDDDKNGYIDDVYGYDFADNKPNGFDDNGHGSHCAGTIGGRGDNGKGVVGVNWNVRFMALKFLTASGSGSLAGAIKAIDYAVKMGATLTSNSWGGGGFSQTLKDAIDRAEKAGQLFVAAAANDGADNDRKAVYPASYEVANILTVAAVGNQGELASFSNYGKTSVDIAGPGVNIYSSTPGNAYSVYSGTSMATPHVSGVAALLWGFEPQLKYAEVKRRLMASSTPLVALKNKTVSGGLVNAFAALKNEVAPPDAGDPATWKQEPVSVSTPHPYPASYTKVFEIKIPTAKRIAAYFDRCEVEREFSGVIYDKVEFFDGNDKSLGVWTGTHNGEFSPIAEGDTIKVKITTDDSYHLHGFDISRAAVQY